MKIIRDELYLCSDCTQVACNGPHGLDIPEKTLHEIVRGLSRLGLHLVSDFDSETGEGLKEVSSVQCASCKTSLAGYRARFAILGEDISESL